MPCFHNPMKYNNKYLDKIIITMYYIRIVYLINTIWRLCALSKDFFLCPTNPMQKRYEALRASFVEGLSANEVAHRFGYSVHTLNVLRRDFKSGSLPPFFQPLIKGPKQPRPSTLQSKDRIIELRKQNYSIDEIEEVLLREGVTLTGKTSIKSFMQKALPNSFAEPMLKNGLLYKWLRSRPR